MGFVVVEFKNYKQIAVVPSCWVTGPKDQPRCKWPDHIYRKNPSKFRAAVKLSQQPDENFVDYEIRILREFVSIEKAQMYAKKLEKEGGGTSSQSSQKSLGRGKRKQIKRKFVSESEESDSDQTISLDSSPLCIPNMKNFNLSQNQRKHVLSPITDMNLPETENFNLSQNRRKRALSPITDMNISETESFNLSQENRRNHPLSPIININVPESNLNYIDNSQSSGSVDLIISKKTHTSRTSDFQSFASNNESIVTETPNRCNLITDQVWTVKDIVINQLKIMRMLQNVTDLLTKQRSEELLEIPPNLKIDLPICSLKDFDEFEAFLEQDENMYNMMKYLKARLGAATDMKDFIISILKSLLKDDVAKNFNYFGKIPKKKFHGTKMEKLVYCTTRSVYNECNTKTYKPCVMNWLKYSGQRMKNKRNLL